MNKYHRIYVAEAERSLFLKSLVKLPEATPVQKTTVLKDSAIHHLQKLFSQEVTTEILAQGIADCREVVEGMIDVVGDYRVDQLQDLIANLSFHDFYTYDHSINVAMYCILIFKALEPGARRSDIVQAGLAGLLHDLGKIKISTEILNSPEKLTPEQFEEIKKHPAFGYELLNQVKPTLPEDIRSELVGRVIIEHHENYDGSGYPYKLSGRQIHVLSRITTIADFFDAITTKRSYHEPLTLEDALALMSNSQGKKIDPDLFQFFVKHTQQMELRKHLNRELAAEFDPCQPCRELPLVQVAAKPAAQTLEASKGSVKIAEPKRQEGVGKIRVIDTSKPRTVKPTKSPLIKKTG
jgi:HD-GYP domain-containing protein (c-di-GMP phosphodiesterase class II)